ncbi:MAG: nucleotidyltransferase family protein [Deltaproteobacteria bacterium]|nr:nucleotidyltransferase family protein [Deltaproteobacteria bacterium]
MEYPFGARRSGPSPKGSARHWMAVCTPAPSPEALGAVAREAASMEEPGWLARAVSEGLGPMLYWRLTAAAEPVSPPEKIRRVFWKNFAAQSLRSRHVGEVLGALASERVAAAPLGGTWLAEEVYPHAALRPHAHSEILVSPRELERAKQILIGLGLSAAGGRPGKTSSLFLGADLAFVCRVHWALGTDDLPFAEAEELLARSSQIEWREAWCFEIPAHLQLALLLARLCAVRQGAARLLRLVDVPWTVARFGLAALGRALTAVAGFGWERPATAALASVQEVLAWDPRAAARQEAVPRRIGIG